LIQPKEFAESQKPLNILVNNAGCMVNQKEFVEETLEVNFATNTLGTHILTRTLLPVLANS
jgi:dehydrogenase/reductase SDR family protein 12